MNIKFILAAAGVALGTAVAFIGYRLYRTPSVAEALASIQAKSSSIVRIESYKASADQSAFFAHPSSAGTGWIVKGVLHPDRAYIITNRHVALGEKKSAPIGAVIFAVFPPTAPGEPVREPMRLKVLGYDAADLALLVPENSEDSLSGFAPLALGNPNAMNYPGAAAITAGYPLDSETLQIFPTVISSVSANPWVDIRDNAGSANPGPSMVWLRDVLAPGNSGGPLFDVNGNVIGINTLHYPGIGFSIPANVISRELPRLEEGGEVPHAILGIAPRNSWDIPDLKNTGGLQGPAVIAVSPNSPASQAGFKRGDIILSCNGVSLPDTMALRYLVYVASKPHDTLRFLIVRNGQVMKLTAQLTTSAELQKVAEAKLGDTGNNSRIRPMASGSSSRASRRISPHMR